MSLTEHVAPAACPACAAAPAALDRAAALPGARIILSIPLAHCAACIATIEDGLARHPGVRSARVNLTLKRVSVDADPQVAAESLIPVLARLGYEALELDAGLLSQTETDRQGRDLLMRLGVAGFAMMNIMLLSVAVWSGAEDATRDLFHWVSALIAIPTVAFAGQPFFRAAWASLRALRLGMDVPISLALILATAISVFETSQSGEHAYFDAAVMLCYFLLAGRWLDHRTRAAARSAAQELAALEVPRATRLTVAGPETVAVAALAPGDLIRILPGGRLPADGEVTEGTSELDRSLLTGETLPVPAAPGSRVAAGEVNLTGPLTLRVTAAGTDSSLHRLADLVAMAESARTRLTGLAERASRLYSPLVHIVSLAAFVWWLNHTGGDLRTAVNISAAVLIITCPCALGLAVPAVVTAASGRLFRRGFLVKHGTSMERLAEVDTVVFDKTGTLTLGAPQPLGLDSADPAALAVARGLAQGSAHPLARALADTDGAAARVTHIREVPGFGIEGQWQGRSVRLGRAAWVGAGEVDGTATYLCVDGRTHVFRFADRLRPGAEKAVSLLAARGLRVLLLSGDAEAPVAALAATLGIPEWTSGMTPEDKAARVAALAARGRKVLMVGDGLNDTAALAGAHVSISPASALDAARTASDIVLLGRDLGALPFALRVARVARRRIVENFLISGAYNVVAVPFALAGLATPLAAALAMSLSSLTVSLNALRLPSWTSSRS
jgi:Cu2+-exporting ATPase